MEKQKRAKSVDVALLKEGALFSSGLREQFEEYYHLVKMANCRITRSHFMTIQQDHLHHVDLAHQRHKVMLELRHFHHGTKTEKTTRSITQKQKQILLRNMKNNQLYFSQQDIPPFPDSNYHLQQSKAMQFNYEYGSEQEKYQILMCCLENLEAYYRDKYKNYILQKIVELGRQDHVLLLNSHVHNSLDQVLYDKFGAKVCIRLLEYLYQHREECGEENRRLQDQLMGTHLQTLLTHENGNFVVQKMIEIYQGHDLEQLVHSIQKHIIRLCLNKYGCLIIQKLIDIFAHRTGPQQRQMLDATVSIILDSGLELSFKEYSNYIIQHILEAKDTLYQQQVLTKILLPNFVEFATDQYGSNVAEKAIVNSDAQFKTQVWRTLKQKHVIQIVNNRFGNYVMQKFYQYSSHSIQHQIYTILKQNHTHLSNEGRFVWKTIIKQNEHTPPN